MAFTKNYINEIFGTVLVLSSLLSTASAVDCHGKSFHCVNSTHFMICVDLGGGVSQAIENYFIACPPPTTCQGTNHYECEFPAPTTPVVSTSNVITEATLPWEEVVTAYSTENTTEEFSENYMNTERMTTAAEYSVTTDTTVEVTGTTASDFNFAGIVPPIPVDIAPNALETVTDNSSINETVATANATTIAEAVGNVTQSTVTTRRLPEIEPATVEITTSRVIDTTAKTVTENFVITETVTTEVDYVAQIATDQIIQTSSEKPVELDTVQLNIEIPQIVDWFQNDTLRNTTTSKDPITIDNITAHIIEKDLSNKHLSTVANKDTMIPITHKPNVLVTEGSFRNDLQPGSESTITLVTEATKNKMKHLTTLPVAKITTYEYPSSTYVYETDLQKNNRVEESSLNQDQSVLSIKSHADSETMKQLPTGMLAQKTPESSQTDYTVQESSTIINEWIDGANPTTSLVGDVFPEVVITTNMPLNYEENTKENVLATNPTTSLVGDVFPEVVITTNMPLIYEENKKENVLATTDQTQVVNNNNTVAASRNQVVLTTENPVNLTTSDGAFGENGLSSEHIAAINVEMLTSKTTQTVAAVDLNVRTTEAVPLSTTLSNGSAVVTETPLLTTNMQNLKDTTLDGNADITERPIIINEESLIMDITQNVTIENTNIPLTQVVNLDFTTTEALNIRSNNIKDVTGKPKSLLTHNFSDTFFDGALTTETIQNGASFYEPPTAVNKDAVDTIQNIPVYITVIPPNQPANLDKINTEDKESMSTSPEHNNNQMVPTTSKASAVSGTQLLTTQNMLEELYLDGAVTEAVHNSAVTEQRNEYDISFTTDTIRSIVTDKNNQVTIPAVVSITETDGLYTPISITGTQPSVSASQGNTLHKYQKLTTQLPNFASATLVDAELTANKLDRDADVSTIHPTTMNDEKLAFSYAQNAVSVNTINPSKQTVHVDMTTTEAVNMPSEINNAQAMHPGFIRDKTPSSVLDDVSKVYTEASTNGFITTPMPLVTKTDDVPFNNVVEPSLNTENAIIGYENNVVKNDSNNIISNGVTEDQGYSAFASSSSNDFKLENNTNLDQINNTLGHLELTSTTKYGILETLQTGIKDNYASNVYLGPREELTSTTKNNLPNPTVILSTDEPIFRTGPSGAENIEVTLLPSTQGLKNVIVPTQSTDAINTDKDKYGKLYPNVPHIPVNVDKTLENANEHAFSHALETPQTGRLPITDNFNTANANNQQSKSGTIRASVQPGTQPSTAEINVQSAKSKPNPKSTSNSSVTNVNIGTNGNMEELESSIQDKSQSNSNASNVSIGPQEELTPTIGNTVPNPTVSYNTDKLTLHTVQSGIETTLLQSSQSSKHVIMPSQSTGVINIYQDKSKKLWPNVEPINTDKMYEKADKNNQKSKFTNKSSVTKINAGENYTSTVNYDTQFISEHSPTSSITTGRSIKAKGNEQSIKDTTSSIGISTSNVLVPNDHLETVTEINSVHETYSKRGLKAEVPVRNNGLDLTSPTTASAKINAANNAIITSTQNKYDTVSTLSPSVSTIDGIGYVGNNIRESEKSATVLSNNQENKSSQGIKETIITNKLSTADKPKEKDNTFSKPILDKLPLSNQHNKLNTDVTNIPPLTDLRYNSQIENTVMVTEPYITASSNPITNIEQGYSNDIGISTASTISRPSLNSQTGITNTGNYVYLRKNPSVESLTSTVILPLASIDKNINIPLVTTLEDAALNSPTVTDVSLQQTPQLAKKFIHESSVEKGPTVTETNKKNNILISTSTESIKVGISTESVLADTSQKHIPEGSIFNPVYPKNNSRLSKNTSETNSIQLTSIGTQKIHTNTVQSSAKPVTSSPISHVSNHRNKQIPHETDRTYTCVNGIRGRYSDRNNCRKYYLCIGNNQPIVGNCPENTVFSDLKKLCTKNLSHCIRENEFKCPSAGRFSDFLKDAIYYVCINHNNHLYRFKFQCQKGYILNKTTVNCIETKEIESNESVSISSSDNSSQTGITGVGISSANSKTTSTRNGSSTVGNVSSKYDDSTNIQKRKETSDISEAKEDEDDDEVFKCKKEGKFPIRNECRKYYLCKKNRKEYRRKIKKCDSDSVFNKDKKKCVDADSYECEREL